MIYLRMSEKSSTFVPTFVVYNKLRCKRHLKNTFRTNEYSKKGDCSP